jgi:molybdopterin/thiamine biosynthesis adenylyltransferase
VTAAEAALARTTLLLNRELFSGSANPARIAEALLATRVTIRSSKEALETRAGQTGLITAFILISRLGVGIDLDIPEVALIDRAAPLRGAQLRSTLHDLSIDLIPGRRSRVEESHSRASFFLGDSDRGHGGIGVTIDDFGFAIDHGIGDTSCKGDLPFGGLAAGAAIAALALEAAIPGMEDACGQPARSPRPRPGPSVRLDLRDLFPALASAANLRLGDIDVISGGAITNALVYCLLRLPDLQADLRVIESDVAELSNLNRYMLLRRSHLRTSKTRLLEASANGNLRIRGVDSLFTPATRSRLMPLAPRVLVGADDVQARWWVQEADPIWLAIGATGDHLAQVTTHLPGTPCAGCLHPIPLPPQEIPTISFVSFWAGLLQACALLAPSEGPVNVTAYPFALGDSMPFFGSEPVKSPQCPLRCGERAAA